MAVQFGKYLRGQKIATGGMGEVYVAVQEGLGGFKKPLALKLLLPHLTADAAAVQMFLDEAQLVARMSHPNVVQIFDLGQHAGRYYIALELVRGVSLSALLRRLRKNGVPLGADQMVLIGRALCEALHHAHELKSAEGLPMEIVHRDVSPQNILISEDGEVKLTDFGIAKARDSNTSTMPGVVKGKFEYIAPEQAMPGQIDRRADVYSAAVTLHQAATGLSPFRRDSDAITLRAVEHDALPPLELLRPDLPAGLCQAIGRAAQKEPALRFPSARAFRDALPPPPPPEVAEALGRLVRTYCADALSGLEARTREFSPVVTSTAHTLDERSPKRSRGAARKGPLRAAILGGAGLIGLALLVGALFRPSAPPAALPIAEAPELPTPSAPAAPTEVAAPAEQAPAPPPPTVTRRSAAQAPVAPAVQTARLEKKPGYLTVDANPWAHVYIGGRRIGETPMHRYPVEPGWTTVTLKNPETGRQTTRRLRVRAGQQVSTRADLQ